MDPQVDDAALTPVFHAMRVAILKDACLGAKGFSIAMLGAFDLIPRFLRGSVGRSTASTLSISQTSLISTSIDFSILSPLSSSQCSLFTSRSGFHFLKKKQSNHTLQNRHNHSRITHPTTARRKSVVTSFIVFRVIVDIKGVIFVLSGFLSQLEHD